MNRSLLPLCAALFALTLAACSSKGSGEDGERLPTIAVGGIPLKMELAVSREEQVRGLMGREGIAGDRGMLFVYRAPQQMSFWMKNVDFPIAIGFFTADGTLREVYPMYPNDTLARKSLRDDLLYALEVKAGWFRENGVKPGAQLDLEAVNKALEQRRSR